MRQIYRFSLNVWRKEPCRWLITVVIAAFIGIAAGHTVLGSFGSVSVVDGQSMAPAYESGARVYATPISTPLARGDVVLLDDGKKEYALKRVIGLPGETIALWRGYVFVNCRMLFEPYLPKYTFTFPDEQREARVFRLENEEYLVLGDNRMFSIDSRFYGPIERNRIKSRVPHASGDLHPRFVPFTLPVDGKRSIRPVS
jgi:signal peptidase I